MVSLLKMKDSTKPKKMALCKYPIVSIRPDSMSPNGTSPDRKSSVIDLIANLSEQESDAARTKVQIKTNDSEDDLCDVVSQLVAPISRGCTHRNHEDSHEPELGDFGVCKHQLVVNVRVGVPGLRSVKRDERLNSRSAAKGRRTLWRCQTALRPFLISLL